MKNWDELRIFLAVAEGGSITEGAEILKVDQSTVSRRIQAFERQLGRKLFQETKKRNKLTLFGESCLSTAKRIKEELFQFDQVMRLQNESLTGTIQVYTEGVLSSQLLLSVCSSFLDRYPELNLRISNENDHSPNFRADVGFFTTNTPELDYSGKKLATATFASYANPVYLEKFATNTEEMSWLNWDDGSDSPTWPKLSPKIPDANCRLRSTSVPSLIEAARQGLGATVLPCFIGEQDSCLVRVEPGKILSYRDVWVFVQPDIRSVPRIRHFLDHIYLKINEIKHLIETDLKN